jgi:peptidoglycan hydrolase-like protein with peptidoglycan-binding domain
MNKIIFPLKPGMRGESVADLQDGLQLLLDKGGIQPSAAELQVLEEELHIERSQNSYGHATTELVDLFQKQHHLSASNGVDEATAKALNAMLKELGSTTRADISALQKKYRLLVIGELNTATCDRIVSVAASRPIPVKHLKTKEADYLVPIKRVLLRFNMTNSHVGEAQQSLAYLDYNIDEKEFKTKTFGKTTREAVVSFQRTRASPIFSDTLAFVGIFGP